MAQLQSCGRQPPHPRMGVNVCDPLISTLQGHPSPMNTRVLMVKSYQIPTVDAKIAFFSLRPTLYPFRTASLVPSRSGHVECDTCGCRWNADGMPLPLCRYAPCLHSHPKQVPLLVARVDLDVSLVRGCSLVENNLMVKKQRQCNLSNLQM